MATSGLRGGGQILDDSDLDLMKEWPLTYVRETKECVCGWCGQALVSTHNTEDIETHFKSCESAKDNGLAMNFKQLRKMDQKLERFDDDVQLKVEEKIEEVKAEILNIRTEFNKEISDLKSEIKNDLEMEMKERDAADNALFWKVKVVEDGQKEKMAEVSGRVSGVTETVSTVVRSILEAKGTSSAETNEPERSQKETEEFRAQMRKSEREIQSLKTELEEEIARLKTRTETVSKRLKANDGHLRAIKTQLQDKNAKNESSKRMSFHVEPSPFQQLAISMTCFSLVAHNYLFQPSFRWTIAGIDAITAQKTFELSSELFQWNGYPVQAWAKLQLKEDDCFYMSLKLKDVLKDDRTLKDFKPIPFVFYSLKDKSAINPRHKCRPVRYLSRANFSYSLNFNGPFVHKSWFNHSTYKVDDSVEVEIYVEPSPLTQLAYSYDGTLEWNVESFSRRLMLEKGDFVPNHGSPYFYTSARGYRVQVELYLNGDERKMMTARISFLTGKFDAELPVSFPHRTIFTLVNRKDPQRSISNRRY